MSQSIKVINRNPRGKNNIVLSLTLLIFHCGKESNIGDFLDVGLGPCGFLMNSRHPVFNHLMVDPVIVNAL